MTMIRRFPMLLLASTLLVGMLSACGTMAGVDGPIEIALSSTHDATAPIMTAEDAVVPDRLVVSISGIQLVGEASGPIDVTFKEGFEPPFDVDLMALDPDEQLVIADASAVVDLPDPSTTFDQVRFIVASATVFFGDEPTPVTVPSGAQSGLKVNVDPAAGPGDTVTVEFDVARLIETGNGGYNLVPTAVRAFVVDEAPADEPVVEPIEAD